MQHLQPPRQPPHCPNAECDNHRDPDGRAGRRPGGPAPERWFCLTGSYERLSDQKRVQRYRCRDCRRSFSLRTFSLQYWLHRDDLLEEVFHHAVSCAGYRQVARALQVSVGVVARRVERLGRQCALVHESLRPREPPTEPLALDGFESFAHSQYEPHHLNLLVGGESHYTHGFSFAELRRKGRMTDAQRARRAELEERHGRADRKAIQRSVARLLRSLFPEPCALCVHTDEHPAYPGAWRRIPEWTIEHHVTSSRVARTPGNPLFPANRNDLLLRHFSANHKRETVAFSKRNDVVVLRAWITLTYCNYVKRFSEKERDGPTPAMKAGVVDRALSVGELLAVRLFPERVEACPVVREHHRQEVPTRFLPAAKPPRYRYVA